MGAATGGLRPTPRPGGNRRGARGDLGDERPANATPGRSYGLGMLGAELTWDRDRWRGRFALTPVVSLSAGLRNTSGESTYLTGILGLGVRWYFLGPLGLSATAVRIEPAQRSAGRDETDDSTGVHGPPGGEYYFLPGSRLGLALQAWRHRDPGGQPDDRLDLRPLRDARDPQLHAWDSPLKGAASRRAFGNLVLA